MRCLLFALLIGMVLAAFICWMPVRTDDHSQVIHPTLPVRTEDVIHPTLPVRTEDVIDPTLPVRTEDVIDPTLPVRTDDVIDPTLPVRTDDVIDRTLPVRTEDVIDRTLPVRTDDRGQVIDSMPGKHAGPLQWIVKWNGMFCVWPHFLVTFSTT